MPRHATTPLIGCVVLGLIALSGCSASSDAASDPASFDRGTAATTGAPAPEPETPSPSPSAPADVAPAEGENRTQSGSDAGPERSGGELTSPDAHDSATEPDSGTAQNAAPSLPSKCTFEQLSVSAGPTAETTRDGRITLEFTNSSAQPCTLQGTPDVALVSAVDGLQQGPASRADGGGGSTVTLAPGELAVSTLTVSSDKQPCSTMHGDGLLVFPPGSSDAAYVPQVVDACASGGKSVLRAGAVTGG